MRGCPLVGGSEVPLCIYGIRCAVVVNCPICVYLSCVQKECKHCCINTQTVLAFLPWSFLSTSSVQTRQNQGSLRKLNHYKTTMLLLCRTYSTRAGYLHCHCSQLWW